MAMKEVMGVRNKPKKKSKSKEFGKKQGEKKSEKKGRISSKNVFLNATKN
jgi:hypothetical protein